MTTAKYAIQTVSQPFSGRIPEHLWKTVGYAQTARGAYQRYAKEHAWYHPQQNAWTGHVRVIDTERGKPVQIERVSTEHGPAQYDVYPLS